MWGWVLDCVVWWLDPTWLDMIWIVLAWLGLAWLGLTNSNNGSPICSKRTLQGWKWILRTRCPSFHRPCRKKTAAPNNTAGKFAFSWHGMQTHKFGVGISSKNPDEITMRSWPGSNLNFARFVFGTFGQPCFSNVRHFALLKKASRLPCQRADLF